MNRIREYLEDPQSVATLVAEPGEVLEAAESPRDREDLRLLVWLNYFTALVTLFPVLYVTHLLRDYMRDYPATWEEDAIFVSLGIVAVAIWTLVAALLVVSAELLRRRRLRRFSTMTALAAVLLFPVGWITAVYTIVTLSRASVRRMYR